ncbi:hypothetical protein INF30_05670 [Lachnospiraceae bacterium DSM 108991]|uniref:Uncharacterized protein n=1 Tax=Claveliimonas monacensis TaxID=2779351 RepID=A0ABR9RIF7_9FIRM|nr:DUF6120 family protein [Claveliimonas monacensis]MBE5062746.1 hypothetical protein [Claveliimonas monacensis]
MQSDCVKEYYRILKAIFPLKSYYEAKFLKEYKNSLIEFSNHKNHCTFDDLVAEFGSPQEVLLEYMDAQDSTETSAAIKKQNTRKYILLSCALFLFLGLLIYTTFLYGLNQKVEKAIPDKVNTTIIDDKEEYD